MANSPLARALGAAPIALLATLIAGAAPAYADHADRLDGALDITNDQHEPVRILVDGLDVGQLAPLETRRFHGVLNGVRVVRVEGRHGPPTRQRVSVPISGVASLTVPALLGTASVLNDSGLTMRLELDGEPRGALRAGATRTFAALRPGTHVLTARPVGYGGPALSRKFQVSAGRETEASIGQWFARVEVFNPSSHPGEVRRAGARPAPVPAGGRVLIDGLAPGEAHLALTLKGETVAHTDLRLQPGETRPWAPQLELLGSVALRNATRDAVLVEIAGRVVLHLAPGESGLVRDLAEGHHVVHLRPAHGPGWSEEVFVSFGDTTRVALAREGRHDRGRGRGRGRGHHRVDDHLASAPAPLSRR